MTEDDKKRFDYLKGWLENADVSFVMPTIHELQARIESLSAEERDEGHIVRLLEAEKEFQREFANKETARAESAEARVRALEEALCEVWDNYTDDRTLPQPLMEKVRDLIGIATPALGASNG